MSSPISPITSRLDAATPNPPAVPGAGDHAAFIAELEASGRALAIEATRGGPPAEVLEQMRGADAIHQSLRESGHELRFDDEHGRPRIELRTRDGETRSLTVAETAELAAGKPAE